MIHTNKFKEGETVYERTRPSEKMVVTRYLNGIYYCKLTEAPHRKELVYLEKDLMSDPSVLREFVPSETEWVRAPFRNLTRKLENLK